MGKVERGAAERRGRLSETDQLAGLGSNTQIGKTALQIYLLQARMSPASNYHFFQIRPFNISSNTAHAVQTLMIALAFLLRRWMKGLLGGLNGNAMASSRP